MPGAFAIHRGNKLNTELKCTAPNCERGMRRKKLGLCEPHAEDHRADRGEYCTHACAMGARAATPGYYGDGSCLTCGATYQKTGATQEYCTPACYPRPPASEPADLRSPLRKGHEDNNKELFFDALKADCDVDETTGCWSWARQEANGYARTRFGKKEIALHRASLEMKHGKPLGVLAAHHTCANTLCVNPEHLQPATAAENNLEMNARKSFIARIAELENALKEIDPDHEILKRVSAI